MIRAGVVGAIGSMEYMGAAAIQRAPGYSTYGLEPASGSRPAEGFRMEAERQRLRAVHRSGLLETGDEERFDRIVRSAQEAFGVSAASIALITEDQQFLRSFVGPLDRTVDRRHAFCNLTIQGEEMLIVPEALADPRFATNPLVVGAPFIRFYAGCPLRGPGGWLIGTLCIIDQAPRDFTGEDQRVLRALAVRAELELNARP